MIKRETYGPMEWVDLVRPSGSEVKEVASKFNLHPIIVEELQVPIARPKVDVYSNTIYLVLHFPINHEKNGEPVIQEIDFVFGKNFIITWHDEPFPSLDRTREFLKNLIAQNGHLGHAGFVLYYILKHIFESLETQLEKIDQSLNFIEQGIFKDRELEMVEHLALINHDIFDFKKSMWSHKETLASLEQAGTELLGQGFAYYLSALSGEYYKMWSSIQNSKELLKDLQEINDSLLNNKTAQTMKRLTTMAFITLPLTLIGTIFGMNTDNAPIIGTGQDFWTIIGIMLIGMVVMIFWFRHRKWL